MDNKKRVLISSILYLIGAICFAIVAYGNYYNGKIALGNLSVIAASCNIIAVVLNYKNYKNSTKKNNK